MPQTVLLRVHCFGLQSSDYTSTGRIHVTPAATMPYDECAMPASKISLIDPQSTTCARYPLQGSSIIVSNRFSNHTNLRPNDGNTNLRVTKSSADALLLCTTLILAATPLRRHFSLPQRPAAAHPGATARLSSFTYIFFTKTDAHQSVPAAQTLCSV